MFRLCTSVVVWCMERGQTITEKAPINPESYYGECKANSEFLCDLKQDIILRPIHVFGWGK